MLLPRPNPEVLAQLKQYSTKELAYLVENGPVSEESLLAILEIGSERAASNDAYTWQLFQAIIRKYNESRRGEK